MTCDLIRLCLCADPEHGDMWMQGTKGGPKQAWRFTCLSPRSAGGASAGIPPSSLALPLTLASILNLEPMTAR